MPEQHMTADPHWIDKLRTRHLVGKHTEWPALDREATEGFRAAAPVVSFLWDKGFRVGVSLSRKNNPPILQYQVGKVEDKPEYKIESIPLLIDKEFLREDHEAGPYSAFDAGKALGARCEKTLLGDVGGKLHGFTTLGGVLVEPSRPGVLRDMVRRLAEARHYGPYLVISREGYNPAFLETETGAGFIESVKTDQLNEDISAIMVQLSQAVVRMIISLVPTVVPDPDDITRLMVMASVTPHLKDPKGVVFSTR